MAENYIKRILEANVYDVAVETPLSEAKFLSNRLGNNILIKREDKQPVYSFKCRGAYNCIAKKTPEQLAKGVVTASAGNHAQGVALSAQQLGIKATIVMPRTTPEIKVANSMYARAMKAEQVEELRELAGMRATAQNGDMENALRTEFRILLRRIVKGQEQGWSREEVDQLKQIVEGGSAENMARFVGKFSPTGVVSLGVSAGLPYSAVYGATRDPALASAAAGATMTAGFAGKQAGAALQQQNIDRLYQSIVQGRNMSPAAQMRLRAALTSYLAGQAAAQ